MSKHHTPCKKPHALDCTQIDDLKRLSQGKWRAILVAAGMPAESLLGTRGRSCPKCGGRDRYSPMRDLDSRGAVLCRHCLHSQSHPKCGDGIATLSWWLACSVGEAVRWLSAYHGLNRGSHLPRRIRRSTPSTATETSISQEDIERFEYMAADFEARMGEQDRIHCAALLGLPAGALSRLGVGWSPCHVATTWPMRDGDGSVIGIRLRCPETARKWAVKGSRAGLIYDPHAMREARYVSRLWIVEGPTDTAALVSLDLDAIGVPSAGSSRELLTELARRLQPDELVIVADADDAGRRGAERLCEALILVAPLRLITPPSGMKDARQWVTGGADRASIEAAADASPVKRLQWRGGAS